MHYSDIWHSSFALIFQLIKHNSTVIFKICLKLERWAFCAKRHTVTVFISCRMQRWKELVSVIKIDFRYFFWGVVSINHEIICVENDQVGVECKVQNIYFKSEKSARELSDQTLPWSGKKFGGNHTIDSYHVGFICSFTYKFNMKEDFIGTILLILLTAVSIHLYKILLIVSVQLS